MVHTSSFGNILLRCRDVTTVDREKHLNHISTLLRSFFTIHLGFVFHLNSHYMMASDYVEYLEVGEAGGSYSHNNADYLVNCKTNTISMSIPAGTRWKFVEIQLLPRLKNDNMGLDDRCPVVFVIENEQYGRYYVYYEDLARFT